MASIQQLSEYSHTLNIKRQQFTADSTQQKEHVAKNHTVSSLSLWKFVLRCGGHITEKLYLKF